jgi:hypothetical protein
VTSFIHQMRQGIAQPSSAAAIDFAHPLARGLEMFLVPMDGGIVDLVNPGQVWAPAGAAKVGTSETDLTASFDGSNGTQFSSTGYSNVVGVGTLFFWARSVGTEDTNGHIYLSNGASVYYQTAYGFAPSSQKYYVGTGVTGSWTTYPFVRRNTSQVITGKGMSAFLDGVLNATPGGMDGTAFPAGSKTLYIGRYQSANDWNAVAEIVAMGWTTEAWTEREAALWHANPWQFVRRRRVFPRAAAAAPAPARPQIFFIT